MIDINKDHNEKHGGVGSTASIHYQNYADLPLTLDSYDLQIILRIPRASAYRLMHDPRFPAIRVGGRILVPRDKFIGWIESKTSVYDSIRAAEMQQRHPMVPQGEGR